MEVKDDKHFSYGSCTRRLISIFNFSRALFVVFIFLIRPEKKRKKQLEDMRSAITVGDEIVTIGGIMGKVVQATEETITFETGEDRVRLQVTKWAISVNVREEQKKAQQNKNTEGKKKAKTSRGSALKANGKKFAYLQILC